MGSIHDEMISKHFSFAEALWLPKWNRMATEADGLTPQIIENLVITFKKMDVVHEYFNSAIRVHCAYRPKSYNAFIGGAKDSAHIDGLAVDFDVVIYSCQKAIGMILNDNKLEEWNLRMEDNGEDPSWIHLDSREVLPEHNRYFKP